MSERSQVFCRTCKKDTLHELDRDPVNHIAHFLAFIFLCGFWLPIWLIMIWTSPRRQWRCLTCGQVPGTATRDDRIENAKAAVVKRIARLEADEERSIARERMRLQAMETAGNVAGGVGNFLHRMMWLVLDGFASTVDSIGTLTLRVAGGDQFMAWFFNILIIIAMTVAGSAGLYAAYSIFVAVRS